MPENVTQADISSQTDPSVSKQYDDKTDKVEQITDFFKMVDGQKVSMLNTHRSGVGASSLLPHPTRACPAARHGALPHPTR